MKTFLMAMTALSAAAAVPALAQSNQYGTNQYGGQVNLQTRIGTLQSRLQAGVQAGAISRAEAQPLRAQLRDLSRLERQYAAGGLTGQERSDLQQRMRALRQNLRVAEGNQAAQYDQRYGWADEDGYTGVNNGYAQGGFIDRNRDGYDDRDLNRDRRVDAYDTQGGYQQQAYGTSDWIDRNRDGYDDRDVNRDRRVDGYDAQGGPYEPTYTPQSNGGLLGSVVNQGVGGVIGSVLGGGSGVGGVIGNVLGSVLGVGQRATGGLFGVPNQYQNQYRDNGNIYYRSDGRQIYGIDARTNTVVQVYPMQ